MITSAITYTEAGQLLVGIAAFMTITWTIFLACFRRFANRAKEEIQTTLAKMLEDSGAAMQRQFAGVEKATYVTLDYRMDGADTIRIPLCFVRVVSPLLGLRLQLVDHTSKYTKYSISTIGHHAPVRLHWHFHEAAEVITVIEGTMTDVATGRCYEKGETWAIAPGLKHACDFMNFYGLATIRPPLPFATTHPINLKSISRVYDSPEPDQKP